MRAHINVDLQRDFGCRDGALYVLKGESIIPICNRLTWKALESGEISVFSRDWHPPGSPHFRGWPVHCVADTLGAQFHPDLFIPGGGIIISKGIGDKDGYSAFDREVLAHVALIGGFQRNLVIASLVERLTLFGILKSLEISETLIRGLATDYCVKATATRSCELGLKTKVIIDTCRAVNLNLGDEGRAIEEMIEAGAEMVASDAVLAGAA